MSTGRSATIDALEPRRFFTFTTLDPRFGSGGIVRHQFEFSGAPTYDDLTPLADGRLIAATYTGVRFFRGDGTVDPKRRDGGFDFSQAALDVAVDPASGRFAVLRHATPDSGLSIDLYDAKGRRVATRVLNEDFVGTSAAMASAGTNFGVAVALAPDGSVLVAVPDPPIDGTSRTAGDAYIDVRRYDATLEPDSAFGTARVVAYADYPVGVNRISLSTLALDSTGRAYVGFRLNTPEGLVASKLARVTAGGDLDSSYGSGGFATFYSFQKTYDGQTPPIERTTTDLGGVEVKVTADGRAYMLAKESILPGDGSQARYVQYTLIRLGSDGRSKAEVNVGREFTNAGSRRESATLAAGGDGHVYVATNVYGETATVFKYDDTGGGLVVAPGWSNFGEFAVSPAIQATYAAAVDRGGRLLIAGGYSAMQISAVNGTAEVPASLPSNSVKRMPDGSVLINGTSKGDTIDVTTKNGRLRVKLNGKTTEFRDVRFAGVVIRAGNGNDRITLGAAIETAYVEAGAGDDVVSSTARFGSVTLVGGSGNDRLTGSTFEDYLYGQDGNDTLIGGGGADEIFGGNGDDEIYASSFVVDRSIRTYDRFADRIDPGKGLDLIHVDYDVTFDYDEDEGQLVYTLLAIDLITGNTTGDTIVGR